MYPENIKAFVQSNDINNLDREIESNKKTLPVYWAKVAKADLFQNWDKKYAETINIAYTLYEDVINGQLEKGKPLPMNLIHWAMLGKAKIIINDKNYLQRGSVNNDIAYTLLDEILSSNDDDELLIQEASMYKAKILLRGSKSIPANVEESCKILLKLFEKELPVDLHRGVTHMLISIINETTKYIGVQKLLLNNDPLVKKLDRVDTGGEKKSATKRKNDSVDTSEDELVSKIRKLSSKPEIELDVPQSPHPSFVLKPDVTPQTYLFKPPSKVDDKVDNDLDLKDFNEISEFLAQNCQRPK